MDIQRQRAVCVQIEGSRRIVEGLDSKTTAQDVINALRISCEKLLGPLVLLETWNGCCRLVGKKEKICSLMEHWDNEARSIKLVAMSSYQYNKKRRGDVQNARLYRIQTHGKVAARRRRLCKCKKTKRKLAVEIQGLLETVKTEKEKFLNLTTSKQPREYVLEEMAAGVSPEHEEECIALQEELQDERREHLDLVQRQRELLEKIQSQQREAEELKRNITMLEAKVSLEERQLLKLSGSNSIPEVEGAQKEIVQLQNELKVRTKLNKLQSSKIHELSSSTSKTEQAIKQCSEQIAKLKLELGVFT